MTFETNKGPMTGGQLINELNYACYRSNRAGGMPADKLASKYLFGPEQGAAMEARYQQEMTVAA